MAVQYLRWVTLILLSQCNFILLNCPSQCCFPPFLSSFFHVYLFLYMHIPLFDKLLEMLDQPWVFFRRIPLGTHMKLHEHRNADYFDNLKVIYHPQVLEKIGRMGDRAADQCREILVFCIPRESQTFRPKCQS